MKIKKEDILSTAQNIVAEKGLEALSMREVARSLGVQPGAFYHHIKNFDELKLLGGRALLQELNRELEKAQSVKDWAIIYFDFLKLHSELIVQGQTYSNMADLTEMVEIQEQFQQLRALPSRLERPANLIFPLLYGAAMFQSYDRERFAAMLDDLL